MNIHDELHRLILRRRWTKWAHRQLLTCNRKQVGNMKYRLGCLSCRLARLKPTWEQRWPKRRDFDAVVHGVVP